MNKRKKSLLLTALCLSANMLTSQAQVTTSGMNGSVTDGKEPLIGATVRIIHVPSGTEYDATTNIDGRYSVQGMRTGGPYKIEITYIGYKKTVFNNVKLSLGDNYVLNAKLVEDEGQIGEVVVLGNGTKFSGTKTGAATNVTSSTLNTLPSISRSLSDFTKLSAYAGTSNSFGGLDSRMNNITIDGANFNNNFGLTSTTSENARRNKKTPTDSPSADLSSRTNCSSS